MQQINQKNAYLLIVCLGWIVVLNWVAVLPGSVLSELFFIRYREAYSSPCHMAAYGIFSFLICPYLRSIRNKFIRLNMPRILLVAVVFSFGWGIVTELIQTTCCDRRAEFQDVEWNLLGALIGVLIYSSGIRLRTTLTRRFSLIFNT